MPALERISQPRRVGSHLRWSSGIVTLLLLGACASDVPPAPLDTSSSTTGEEPSTTQDASSTASADTGTGTETEPDTEADPAAFFVAIGGLWVAPVTSWTSVGSFPTMNMDVRAASEGVLFSRVDLDADNALRFAFALEEHDGQTTLVFRNGGEFLGIPRDNRTALHERVGDTWRFCALSGGCGYIDARFAFEDDDTLALDVDVLGMRHIEWIATRREARALGGAFPSPPVVPGDAPFPPMPSLEVTAQWTTPLARAADVWVMLSTTACGTTADCVPSRYLRAEAPAGATQAVLHLEQIHAGEYRANAVVDRNRNLSAGSLLPDSGDAISIPLDTVVSVPEAGTGTLTLSLWTDL